MMFTKESSRPIRSVVDLLIGAWNGAGEVFPNPWGYHGATTGHWRFSLALGDKHVLADYREARHDGSSFEGHGILMQEQESDDLLWYWFDSLGYPPIPSRGVYDGTGFVFVKESPRGRGRTTLSVSAEHLHYEAAFQAPEAADFQIAVRGRYARYDIPALAAADVV